METEENCIHTIQLPLAVIDTSFWSQCCQVGLVAYLWKAFSPPLLMPAAVHQEIFDVPGPFKEQKVCEAALEAGRLFIRDPGTLIPIFRPGEQAVLSLAQELKAVALVDDYRPYRYGRDTLGLPIFGVGEWVVDLVDRQLLSIAEGQAYVATLATHGATSPRHLVVVTEQLNRRAAKGENR